MVDFQEDNFEQKLLSLKDTQDSIQSLSLWCLKHQSQHKKVVSCWLHVLKKVKVEQRVTLFYLANDVIQYSKRKGYPFVESWATALQKATPSVRDDKVKHKILRLFKIWDERNIYDETFLADLSGLLTANTKKSSQPSTVDLIQEFQPSLLFSKIRKCKILEEDTDLKLKIVKESSIPIQDLDALQVVVKDRRNGDDLMQDIDDGLVKLEAYTKALELEIKERIEVINVLEVSEQFYETQRGEAKVVCNAYRNFGNRIKALKRKLDEMLPTLPSPVPSPDINAPSPSSGSDIEIPEESKTVYDSEKSFIGTDFVTAMNNAATDKQYQYMRDQSYDLENNQSQYSVHSLPNYDSYNQSRDISLPPQGYYSNVSQNNSESPASPSDKHLGIESYSYRAANMRNIEQGNPIEVINSSNSDNHNFSVGQFLQNLMSNNGPPTPVPPTQSKIPGLESPTSNSREVFNFIESKVKEDNVPLWNDKPLNKYQSWPSPDISWNPTQETPVSPPAFERESYSHPVEYVDTNLDNSRFPPPFGSERPMDVDHRILNTKPPIMGHEFDVQIAAIPLPKHDVDDRLPLKSTIANHNLISLTESPSVNDSWKNDSDFRAIPMPPSPPMGLERTTKPAQDIIESVDMEMSDEEDSKYDDKKGDAKFKKSSLKSEEAGNLQTQQLQPPPNPWDMLNLQLDSEEMSNKSAVSEFMTRPGLEMPPRPNFNQFSMPPNPRGMNFPPPPLPMLRLPSGEMFRPRLDFSRMPSANGFNGPFNFMPDGSMMFPPPNNMNQMRKDQFPPSSFSDDNRQYRNNEFSRGINTIKPIIQSRQFEKRLDNLPPFEENSEFNSGPPKNVKPMRSNLKEISLSDVLERTMNEESNKEKERPEDVEGKDDHEENETNDIDLYGDDTANEAGPDDGDDLYNNIEETNEFQSELDGNFDETHNFSIENMTPVKRKLSSDVLFTQNSNYVVYESEENLRESTIPASSYNSSEDTPKMKAPFQATVPKLPKPIMAPPDFMEDCNSEERSPWPMMPVIDLSNENNSPSEYEPQSGELKNDSNIDRQHPLAFLKANGTPDFRPRFGRGIHNEFRPRNFMNNAPRDRRFPNPVPPSPRIMDMTRPRRFAVSPRPEFRPRNPDFRPRGNMPMNQDFRPNMPMNQEFRPNVPMNQEFRPANMPMNQDFRPRNMTPNLEMRPRGGMTPNQDQMRRMPRPNFPRSPGAVNMRTNFPNSPRMFKGAPPPRPFRRGW